MKIARSLMFFSLTAASGAVAQTTPVYVVMPPAPARPNLDLTVHQPAPMNPIDTMGAIANIENIRSQVGLRDAQTNAQHRETLNRQESEAQRRLDASDQDAIRALMEDPAIAKAVESWDGTAEFPLDGFVQPKAVEEMKKAILAQRVTRAEIAVIQQKNQAARRAVVEDGLRGLLFDWDGSHRPDAQIADWSRGMIAELIKEGALPLDNAPTLHPSIPGQAQRERKPQKSFSRPPPPRSEREKRYPDRMASFNWVHARSECSLGRTFAVLGEMLDVDVRAANSIAREGTKFHLSRQVAGKLIVTKERSAPGMKVSEVVVFDLLPHEIRVMRQKDDAAEPTVLFSAAPNLDGDGECLLDVNGAPLKLWQVSRKALESLFFGTD